jgi:rhodanese-related sulfurtransferase
VPTFREMLAGAKAAVREVEPAQAEEEIATGPTVVLDVREPDEYEQGALPDAVHIPRGTIETTVEGRIPDKSSHVVVYCAGGTRSAFAAQTMQELGYTDVASVIGGFNRWKDEGRAWAAPQSLTPEQRNRYQRHLLLPEVGEVGQLKLLDSKVLLLGAGGLGSPAALYLAAAGVGTIGLVDFDIVDESNLQRQIIHTRDRIGMRKTESARIAIEALNSDVRVVQHNEMLNSDNARALFDRYDIIVNGCDNFPTRYLANDVALFARKPIRGAGDNGDPVRVALLPLPLPLAAATGGGSVVRRGRRPRRAPRHRRHPPGHRGGQADHGHR